MGQRHERQTIARHSWQGSWAVGGASKLHCGQAVVLWQSKVVFGQERKKKKKKQTKRGDQKKKNALSLIHGWGCFDQDAGSLPHVKALLKPGADWLCSMQL